MSKDRAIAHHPEHAPLRIDDAAERRRENAGANVVGRCTGDTVGTSGVTMSRTMWAAAGGAVPDKTAGGTAARRS